MKKLLYLAPLPIDFDNLDGVQKKILAQISELNKFFDVDLIFYFENKVKLYNVTENSFQNLGNGTSKLSVLKMAIKLVERDYYTCYIRYPRADYYFIKLLKKLKNNKIISVMEIPTFPYDNEGFTSIKSRIVSCIDKMFRGYIKNYVNRIVTYSEDKIIFGIETINTINGIDFKLNEPDFSDIYVDQSINLIAVSAMFRVHGYDRLIEGLNSYYKNGGTRNIVLKLVGKGDDYSLYQEKVKAYKLENHVLFLGTLFGEALQDVYRNIAVGINSLAIHREGLVRESTLKTKEYAARGLPIVSSSYVDSLSEDGNSKYVLRVKPDESEVDICELIDFVDRIYNNSKTQTVRLGVRNDAKKVCDISVTMKPIISYMLNEEIY